MTCVLQNRLKEINELYVKEFKAIEKQYHRFKLAFQNVNIKTNSLQNYVARLQNLNLLYVAFTKNFISITPKNYIIQVIMNMSNLIEDQSKKIKQLSQFQQQYKQQKGYTHTNVVKTSNNCQKCGQNVRKTNIQQIKMSIQHEYLGLMERMMSQIQLQINQSLFSEEEDRNFFKKLNEALKNKQQRLGSNVKSIQALISQMQMEMTQVVKFKQEYNEDNKQFSKPNQNLIKNIQQSITNLLNQSFKSKIPVFVHKMFRIYEKVYKDLTQKQRIQISTQTQKFQYQQFKLANQKLIKINGLCFKQQNDINWLQNQLQEAKRYNIKKQKQWIDSYQKLNQQNLTRQSQVKSLNIKIQNIKDQLMQKENALKQIQSKQKIKKNNQSAIKSMKDRQYQKKFRILEKEEENPNHQQTQGDINNNSQFVRQTKRKKTLKSKKTIGNKSTKKVHQNLSSINDLIQEEGFFFNENLNDQIVQIQKYVDNQIDKLGTGQSIQFQQKKKSSYEKIQEINDQKNDSQSNDQIKGQTQNKQFSNTFLNQKNKIQMLKSAKSQHYLQVIKVSHLLQEKANKQKQSLNLWKDIKQKTTTKNRKNGFCVQPIINQKQINQQNQIDFQRESKNLKLLQKQQKTSKLYNVFKLNSQQKNLQKSKQGSNNNKTQKSIKIKKQIQVQTQLFKINVLELINIKKLSNWLKQKFNIKVSDTDKFDQNLQQNLQSLVNEKHQYQSKKEYIKSCIGIQNVYIDKSNNQNQKVKGYVTPPIICSGYKTQEQNKFVPQQRLNVLKTKMEIKKTNRKQNIRNSQTTYNLKNNQNQKNQKYPPLKKHQHKSQPTSTYEDAENQNQLQNQGCKIINQQDISLFINEQTAYLYECAHTKNYHKVGTVKLSIDQLTIVQNLYHKISQIKIYSKASYEELITFIRYPYQTLQNNFVGITMIKNMKFSSFINFVQKIMYLHRNCSLNSENKYKMCPHMSNFIQKVKQTFNQCIKTWTTDSIKKQIQRQAQNYQAKDTILKENSKKKLVPLRKTMSQLKINIKNQKLRISIEIIERSNLRKGIRGIYFSNFLLQILELK